MVDNRAYVDTFFTHDGSYDNTLKSDTQFMEHSVYIFHFSFLCNSILRRRR